MHEPNALSFASVSNVAFRAKAGVTVCDNISIHGFLPVKSFKVSYQKAWDLSMRFPVFPDGVTPEIPSFLSHEEGMRFLILIVVCMKTVIVFHEDVDDI